MRKQVLAEDSIDGDDIWRANNEVKLYRAIDKNIDGAQWIATPYSCFQDARNLYMFMEFAQGGNLRDLTGRYGRVLTSDEARFYVGEIAQGLGYIHSLGIIHGDLKLENVLIDGTGHVKLSDFSCAMTMDAIPELWHGTIEYTPPEIAKFRGYFDHTVDWYALGVLMFDLMAGHLPFWTANRSPEERVKLRRQVTKGLCSIRWPSHVQGQAKYFIRRLMRRDPRKRLGANCPFGIASLREPTEVLSHRFFDGVDWDTIQPPESYAWNFHSEDDTAA
ncbi:kinase-like protein [Cylindrobasidium torrendii FP15055 ss-10]|uniref:cAMP-dependent protein kinase n=1 Tax=Cylindrobasidium torrendii FP15055 ss-10 TaxID=1314674 RepID=A0A0D7BEJ4_9AGAR|nr:kinase-like protein [Cylindrobasidium torrendii FP15055 ss-10]